MEHENPGSAPAADRQEAEPQAMALTQFAAKVAHDFNNLLTGLLGNLELLQMRAARQNLPGLEAYLDGANSAGARASAFTARLMQFSGHGRAPFAPVPVDALLARCAGGAACTLNAGAALLLCDAVEFELVMAELLANAAAAGGQAAVSSSLAGGDIIITVSDDGQGMTPEILAQASLPFFSTAQSGTGRGLGLAIAARVVGGMGGRMALAAAPGAGCTVTLTLPQA